MVLYKRLIKLIIEQLHWNHGNKTKSKPGAFKTEIYAKRQKTHTHQLKFK